MGPSCHSLDLANHSHTHASAHHTFKARFSHIQEKSQCMHAQKWTHKNKQLIDVVYHSYFTSDILRVSPQIYYFISNVVLRKK